jgi:hypothetical protein
MSGITFFSSPRPLLSFSLRASGRDVLVGSVCGNAAAADAGVDAAVVPFEFIVSLVSSAGEPVVVVVTGDPVVGNSLVNSNVFSTASSELLPSAGAVVVVVVVVVLVVPAVVVVIVEEGSDAVDGERRSSFTPASRPSPSK